MRYAVPGVTRSYWRPRRRSHANGHPWRADRPLDSRRGSAVTLARTVDGQIDIEGVWDFSTITPLERPASLGDKHTFSEEEAAAFERAENLRQNRDLIDPKKGGLNYLPGSVVPYNEFWYERGNRIAGSRRTSLIVDPPDGRIPSLTPQAQRRLDAQADEARDEQPGTVRADSAQARSLVDRCIVGLNSGPPFTPGAYNNRVQIVQGPEVVVFVMEMVHEPRVVPLDGRPHLPRGMAVQWRFSRPLGRPHARRRHHELPARDSLPRIQRIDAARGALHPHRRRHAALPVHGRGPGDVDAAMDCSRSPAESQRGRLRMGATRVTTRCAISCPACGHRSRPGKRSLVLVARGVPSASHRRPTRPQLALKIDPAG